MSEDWGIDTSEWPEQLDREQVVPCLNAFAEVVNDMDAVTMIITSEFEDTVREHVDPDYADAFHQDRGAYGVCMAKTLPRDDGGRTVIFDARIFLKESEMRPEATFRHEALHVLLHQRGEDLFAGRDRLPEQEAYPDIAALAGITADEYRVERTVHEPFGKGAWESFPRLCAAAHNAIHQAAVDYFWDPRKDVQPVMKTVTEAFSAMATQTAYIAAQLDVADDMTPALEDPALHRRMLGDAWRDMVAAFRRLPPADQPTPRHELQAVVIELTADLEVWLREMGFAAEVIDEENHYFHVYEHEDWVRRGRVAEEWREPDGPTDAPQED